MDADAGKRFVDALEALQSVADELTPDEARATLDDPTLQVFWRDWPHISSWAGQLWRSLHQEMSDPATPQIETDLDEVGGEGG